MEEVAKLTSKRSLLGLFAFPVAELSKRGHVGGGRKSIMVYPPWSSPTHEKGKESQVWQEAYFVAQPEFSDSVRLWDLFVGSD